MSELWGDINDFPDYPKPQRNKDKWWKSWFKDEKVIDEANSLLGGSDTDKWGEKPKQESTYQVLSGVPVGLLSGVISNSYGEGRWSGERQQYQQPQPLREVEKPVAKIINLTPKRKIILNDSTKGE